MRSVPYQRFWLKLFEMGNYSVRYQKVNHRVVLDEGKGRFNNSFVGASIDHDEKVVWIFHTRRLTEADVLHEFICSRRQEMPHDEIDPMCKRLIAARKEGKAEGLVRRFKLGLHLP